MTAPLVVFDAVVFVQALANSGGPAAACWEGARRGEALLVASEETLAELEEVLKRPKLAQRLKIKEGAVVDFLTEVRSVARIVVDVPNGFVYPRDPKDEPLVNLAIAAGSQFLVTWDNDLLDLMKPGNADGAVLREKAPALSVLTPPDFLRALRAARDPFDSTNGQSRTGASQTD